MSSLQALQTQLSTLESKLIAQDTELKQANSANDSLLHKGKDLEEKKTTIKTLEAQLAKMQEYSDLKMTECERLTSLYHECRQERDAYKLKQQQYQDEHADILDTKKRL